MTSARRSQPTAPAYIAMAIIVLAGVVTYANSLSAPLLFDDFASIVRNPQITDPGNLSALLSPLADGPLAGRPLVNVSFAINLAMAGPNVEAFHAVNVALHLLCALVLFGIVRRTLSLPSMSDAFPWRPEFTALIVALLWTVHPLNSEVVDYTTQRSESMMALCYLLGIYGAARSAERGASPSWSILTVAAVFLGTGCKETIATAPLLIVLFDRAFGYDSFASAFAARWRVYVCLMVTWCALGALVAWNGQSFSAGFSSAHVSVSEYFFNQPRMIVQYLWLAMWPQSLVLYYGWPRAIPFTEVWPYLALVTGLFVATLVAVVRRPQLGMLGAAVFLTLGPTSSFIPIATEVGAERRMYLALAALVMLVVSGLAWVMKRWPGIPQSIAVVALMVATSALAMRTIARNREYASALTIAQTVLDRWPTPNAHYLVGVELAAAGRSTEAITHLQEASDHYPPALYYLGQELFKTGRFDAAATALREFVTAEPNLVAVHPAKILEARALEAANKPDAAIDLLMTMVSGTVGSAEIHGMLANLLAERQRFEQAVPHYIEYLRTQPRDGNAWTGLGIAYASTGKQSEAIDAFRKALNTQPGNEQFRANLARAMGLPRLSQPR